MVSKFLYQVENFKQLKSEVLSIITKRGIPKNQIMCQTLTEDEDDSNNGIGRIDSLDVRNEEEYTFIQKSLKGTYLESIILKHRAFRTRILNLDPRRCYSVHRDPTPRIHIPIITNDECWMIWPEDSTCVQFEEGGVYWADTRKTHTFINGSGTLKRIHLVMAVNENY